MHAHKFQIGQNLVYTPGPYDHQKGAGVFEVTRLLPATGDEYQYRIKSPDSGQERVVRESQLQSR
ncbi:hypothetical protein [Caenispirillum bisanense]|uniref:hypothetical protein n=1 Tax=Caenispirillum bisanense TaxID=414052 RepID=UPI0031E14F61